ncbi:MAG: hypothetical protein Q4D71_06955 [Oscillospiraceae bacterium]|nr:hypothetical protein [Oscillospiraceae bacterium]
MGFPNQKSQGNPQETENRQKQNVPASDSGIPGGKDSLPSAASGESGRGPLSAQQQAITEWLSNVKFRRQFIGGLDERSVWNRIRELNMLYEEALRAERVRYDSLLEEYRKRCGFHATSRDAVLPAGNSQEQPAESR